MNNYPNKLLSSLLILGTASILSISYSQGVQGNNLVNIIPPVQHIPTKLLLAQNTDQPRYALVIGNSDYDKVGRLKNPINDADDMGKALRDLDFDVIVVKDASLEEMEDALNDFYLKLRKGGIGLFFYAGHGMQVGGENYLIPIDASLARREDVRYETLPVGKVLSAMEDARNDANFIILDACRHNPFARRWGSRSFTRGLAPQQGIEGSIIAYATAPGDFADDGPGRNGTYTSHLLKHIKTPNISVEEMFKRVRQGVAQETRKDQIPWESSSLIGDFSFNPSTPNISLQGNTSTQSPPSQGLGGIQLIAAVPNADKQQMYQRLEQYLAAGNFRKADEQTWELMKQSGNGGNESYLSYSQIENFSCSALRQMDNLWAKYSNGKFGFTVQGRIWKSLGGNPDADIKTWRRFSIAVDWKTGSENSSDGYLNYDDLTFSTRGVEGHLPWGNRKIGGGIKGKRLFFFRNASCNISITGNL